MIRVYNPVVVGREKSTTTNTNKACFFSSPHKGFELTLNCFEQFKNFPELKDMELHVANPGYYASAETSVPGVVNHGALSHKQVMDVVADSLCVLHLNNVFPETFGLVHAEANALGVPVITSRMGANLEVLDHPQELMDVANFKAVIERVKAWKSHGRPKVRMNAVFQLNKILNEWEEVLR
jgi:glycosyltransferase involved in cell wall biosynthesis